MGGGSLVGGQLGRFSICAAALGGPGQTWAALEGTRGRRLVCNVLVLWCTWALDCCEIRSAYLPGRQAGSVLIGTVARPGHIGPALGFAALARA